MQPWLVGLDVGTTSCKAVVMAPDGREVAAGRAPTPWTTTALGTQTERRSPRRRRPRRALRRGRRRAAPDGSWESGSRAWPSPACCWPTTAGAVAPLIAWHDTRDAAETAALRAELGAQFSVRTGLPLRQQWSLTKHRWQLDHDEAAAAGVRRLGVAEWIVHALGGEQVSELSLASRTGWLDLARRDWWDEALAWSGARRSLLPELVASGEPVGTAHDRWGIPGLGGATLTVAGHDHQAAAIGADAARRARRAGFLRHGRGLRAHGAARAGPRTTSAPSPTRGSPSAGTPCPSTGACWAPPAAASSCNASWPCSDGDAPISRRSTPPPCASNPARWPSPAPTGPRSACARSATTSTRPGSGGPPSPPRSTRVGTSTTP